MVSDLPPVLRRFTVNPGTGCWEWDGPRDRRGYGRLGWQGKTRFSHRLVYEALRGPIPEGLEIDHLCRNTGCCNPTHLEAVTHAENVRRGEAAEAVRATWARLWADRAQCGNGHDLAEHGVRETTNPKGYTVRECVACRREITRRYRARIKEETTR